MALDPRIGVKNPDYSIERWPEFTLRGRDYTRPCRTVGLGGPYFVVIDPFPLRGWQEEVEKLRALVASMSIPPAKGGAHGAKRSSEND